MNRSRVQQPEHASDFGSTRLSGFDRVDRPLPERGHAGLDHEALGLVGSTAIEDRVADILVVRG